MASRASFLYITSINGPASYALFPPSSPFGCCSEGVQNKFCLCVSVTTLCFPVILPYLSLPMKTRHYSFGYLVKLVFLILFFASYTDPKISIS